MKALILGIGGQDGSYLADILTEEGCEVHGLYRRTSHPRQLYRIEHLRDKLVLHPGDVTDGNCLLDVIASVRPDEIYNEADQDNIGYSYQAPAYSWDVTAKAVLSLLEIVAEECPRARVFQPVSSTIFGDAPAPQSESTPLNPLSPYACAKAAALHLAHYYRQCRDVFVSCGILYNHDSPRRGPGYLLHELVTKAAQARLDCVQRRQPVIELGDPEQVVDIGYAREYMRAAIKLLRLDRADDFVLASNSPRTIRELACYAACDIDGDLAITTRPSDGLGPKPVLYGNTDKAKVLFGFQPKTDVLQVIDMITTHKRSRGGECRHYRL